MRHALTVWIGASLALAGCGGNTSVDDAEELGHAVGDVMASFDEAGTGASFSARSLPLDRPGLGRGLLDRALDLAVPPAYAAACWTEMFVACSNSQRVKRFDNCALGANTLSGEVTLTFSRPSCTFLLVGDTVNRQANFTLTGRRNATLTVSSDGGGQTVTRTTDGFTYKVLGMRRVLKNGAGTALVDISTDTLQDIVITGSSRANRTLVSGTLEIVHHLADYTATLTPESLKWNGTCNCPVSGKLTGTATGSSKGTLTAVVEFSGCGTGTVTVGSDTSTVNFDRCAAL